MRKYSPDLIQKISAKLKITPKSVREQISRRALKHNISPEAELANWSRSLKISANPYIRKLPTNIHGQIYSQALPINNISLPKSSVLRIVQIGKKESGWYNLWWVQLLFAFFVVGIVAGTISQVMGAYFANLFGLI